MLESIVKMLSNPSNFDQITQHIVNLYDSEIRSNSNIKRVEQSLKEVDEKLTNYALAIGKGIFNEKTQEIMNHLLEEKAGLEMEYQMQSALLDRPITKEIVANHLKSIFDYKTANDSTKRLLFDAFIKRIEINEDDDITIYCHSVDPDFVLKNEHLDKVFVFDSFGGDGGNRTRVQINLLIDIYSLVLDYLFTIK